MVDKEKNKINKELGKLLAPIYFDQIPLSDMFDVIRKHGYVVVDEAGEPWNGFIPGRKGSAFFDIVSQSGKPSKYGFILQWYKMQVSGNYEIIAYVG